MKKPSKQLMEFIDKLVGGDKDMEKALFNKTAQELIDDGTVEERDLVGGENKDTMPVALKYKDGDYPSNKQLERFIGSEDESTKKTIKEDYRMKSKSVLATFLEDLENGRGFVGLGDDDGVVGAPGFEAEKAIDKVSADMADLGASLDKEQDSSTAEDHLFGDDRVSGEKATVATEAVHIKTKTDYRQAVNALFHNLAEISILSYLPKHRYGKQEHKIVVESMFRAVVDSKKPVLWESLQPKSQASIAKKVAYFQERRNLMLSKPTKKNAAVVESYLIQTNRLLKEVGEAMMDDGASGSGEGSQPNPTEAPVASSVPNSSATVGVATTFGAAMGALKSKISQCNENPDVVSRANCQVAAYDESLGLVRGLLAACGSDDVCKAKVMKAVGRLEVMKSNAQNAAAQAQPPAPDELPEVAPAAPPAAEPPMAPPAAPAPAVPPAAPGAPVPPGMPPAMAPGMAPPMMPPQPLAPVPPVPPEKQLTQEFFDLTKSYDSNTRR